MRFIRPLTDLTEADIPRAGGKAVQCGRLRREGCSSAPGEDGASASFAGIHETRLDVPAAEVTDAVRVCWESVRTPRAMAYRRGRGLSGDATTAVLVQEMILQRAGVGR